MFIALRQHYFAATIALITLGFLLAPVLIIIVISFSSSRYLGFPPAEYSFRWYQSFFSDSSWLESAFLSLQVAVVVTILATLLGTGASVGLVRGRFRGKGLLYSLILCPIIVPGIVVAVASYFFFAGIGLLETRSALILAHTCLALPFVVINVSAALMRTDESLELCARTLGASPLRAFWSVTFPSIRPGVLAGALLSFVVSFDEPIIALFVAGSRSTTLPKRIWDGIRFEIDPTVAAVSVLIIMLTILIVIAAEILQSHASFKSHPPIGGDKRLRT